MEKRVFLIVLDSFGIGAEPDAPAFGDAGTNTLGAIRLRRIGNKETGRCRSERNRTAQAKTGGV